VNSRWHTYKSPTTTWCLGCSRDIQVGEPMMESDRLACRLCEPCIKTISQLYDVFLVEQAGHETEPDAVIARLRAAVVPPELLGG